jgi:hypothetical protein
MNHRIRNRRNRTFAALLAAGLLILGVPGVAAATCAHNTPSRAFSQFGDNAEYVLASGGSFETAAAGWGLSNAGVVQGNEIFHLAPGTHSLAIGPGGSAVSPWTCVSSEYPSFRLVVRQLSGSPENRLNVSLRWVNVLGVTVNSPVAALAGGYQWTPTPVLALGNSVPLWLPGTSLDVGLVFAPTGGTWAIDDVYIDPYSR